VTTPAAANRAALCRHWLAQMNRSLVDSMMVALRGNDERGAQVHALAQRLPQWQGKERLLANLVAVDAELRSPQPNVGLLTVLAANYAEHRAAIGQSTPIELAAARATAADNALPPAERVAKMERDFIALQRQLEADSLEMYQPNGEPGARALNSSIVRDSERVQRESPGPLADRAREVELAASTLFRIETNARRSTHGLDSARAERGTGSPPPGQSATELRLEAMRSLMARYRVPDAFRNPLEQARLLEDAMMFFHGGRSLLQGGFRPEIAEMRDDTYTPAQRMEIYSSPMRFFDYLARSPAGWQQVAEHRLNKAMIFDRLQRDADNGGVLRAPQMREIEAETDAWRRLYLFREAGRGIERMQSEYSSWFLGRPTALRADAPTYTSLVEYYLGGTAGQGIDPAGGSGFEGAGSAGFGALISNNPRPRMPPESRLIAATMDLMAGIERDLAARADPPAVARARETVDSRIARLRTQHDAPETTAQQRVYLDHALRVLGNFRALIERLHPSR
jgi:hypothetical protein